MLIKLIEGCTRILGEAQGYLRLPIRDIKLEDGTPAMQSSWELTPDEIERLVQGAPDCVDGARAGSSTCCIDGR